jgi:hypothetical protein
MITNSCFRYDIESWNGNLRYQNDVQISQQDLVEYYLAPFQACVEANVGACMEFRCTNCMKDIH